MPSPVPTGRLFVDGDTRDLTLSRSFAAPIDDVWTSITETEHTARWFASWSGDAAPGKTIRYRMEFEDGTPEGDMRIDACAAPHHLAVSTDDSAGSWRLEARLVERDGITELTLVHHLGADAPVGEIGPGWEYYLDMLVAARTGAPRPTFDDYYPSQQGYYAAL